MRSKRQTFRFVLVVLLAASFAVAQTRVKPGFNLFSEQEDVQIGQQSAREIESQMPVLKNRYVQRYISSVGDRLSRNIQGHDFPYQFKVVNVSDINAFALPGGFMYVNRGLIEAARSEAELAGVMGHELAHVALRHGTNQVSKAYLAQGGLGIASIFLGGGRGSSSLGQIVNAAGGFGVNAVFLKFSRNAERQADLVGAQTMAKSGYDPMAMASFFDLLAEKAGRNQGGLETFFSTHPAPENRSARIEQETRSLNVGPTGDTGDFRRAQRELSEMGPAPSMADLAKGQKPSTDAGGGGSSGEGDSGGSGGDDRAEPADIETPSTRYSTYESSDRLFSIRYPENWQGQQGSGFGVTLVPRGGAIRTNSGDNIVYGVIVASTSRRDGQGRRQSLEDSSRTFGEVIVRNNSYLRPRDSWRRTTVDGEDALTRGYSGRSPATGKEERVRLVTLALDADTLFYALFINPADRRSEARKVFEQMLGSVRIDR